jgi:hypothetical protein
MNISLFYQGNSHIFVNFFHSLPHLNMYFAKSNSTFDPNNSDYLEVTHQLYFNSAIYTKKNILNNKII